MSENSPKWDGGDCLLWIELHKSMLPPNAAYELVFGEYEDRDSKLREALKDCPDRHSLIQEVFPSFDPIKHEARLIQEEDRSSGFPIRVLQVFEAIEPTS